LASRSDKDLQEGVSLHVLAGDRWAEAAAAVNKTTKVWNFIEKGGSRALPKLKIINRKRKENDRLVKRWEHTKETT